MSGMHILTRQVFAPDLTARTEHPLSLSIYHARGGEGARPRPAPEITELKSGDTVEENGWQVHAASVRHVQPYLQCYGYRWNRMTECWHTLALQARANPWNVWRRMPTSSSRCAITYRARNSTRHLVKRAWGTWNWRHWVRRQT